MNQGKTYRGGKLSSFNLVTQARKPPVNSIRILKWRHFRICFFLMCIRHGLVSDRSSGPDVITSCPAKTGLSLRRHRMRKARPKFRAARQTIHHSLSVDLLPDAMVHNRAHASIGGQRHPACAKTGTLKSPESFFATCRALRPPSDGGAPCDAILQQTQSAKTVPGHHAHPPGLRVGHRRPIVGNGAWANAKIR